MNRRELLKSAAALPLASTAFSYGAFAQGPFPSRNVTKIVPFPPGGQADLAARPVALALERILGKPVIVDNRAGGGGARSAMRRRHAPSASRVFPICQPSANSVTRMSSSISGPGCSRRARCRPRS